MMLTRLFQSQLGVNRLALSKKTPIFSIGNMKAFSSAKAVAGSDAGKHREVHIPSTVHPKFYEDDFEATSIRELEFVRSPFYDLGRAEHLKEGEEAEEFLSNIQLKLGMTNIMKR